METNGIFPDDLVIEILSRLPVRQLLRFKCVSKSWCAIVDDPTFTNQHHDTQYAILKEQGHIPMFSRDAGSRNFNEQWYLDLSYSSEDIATRLHLVSKSFEDVLFLGIEGFSSSSITRQNAPVTCVGYANGVFLFEWYVQLVLYLGLWNPATREFKILPIVPGSGREYRVVVLGFDRMSNDFKIIRVFSGLGVCEIYSLKTNSWKSIEYPSHPEHNLSFDPGHPGVHINSIYYWPYLSFHRVPPSQDSYFILSFDFCKEIFQLLPIPYCCKGKYSYRLANYNGSLACMSFHRGTIDMWVSKVDDHGIPSAWQHLFAMAPFTGKSFQFCSFRVGGDMLLTLSDILPPINRNNIYDDPPDSHCHSCLYDPAAKKITKIFEVALHLNYEYVESLWKLTNSTKSI